MTMLEDRDKIYVDDWGWNYSVTGVDIWLERYTTPFLLPFPEALHSDPDKIWSGSTSENQYHSHVAKEQIAVYPLYSIEIIFARH